MPIAGKMYGLFSGITEEKQMDRGGSFVTFSFQEGNDVYSMAAFRDLVGVVKGLKAGQPIEIDYAVRPKANQQGRIFLNMSASAIRPQGAPMPQQGGAGF